jgi:hypothetical protein
MMIDAMLLQEVTATGEYLRGTNAFGVHQLSEAFTHKFTGSRLLDISVRVWRLFWFIAPHAVAAAAVYYMIVVGVIKLAGVFLAIWALYAMFVYWASRSKRKLRRLFAEMVGLYRRFHGPILSPTRFQHELYKVADQGAIFDPAVFALTEEAIRRNPTTLRGLRSGEFQGWGLYE